MLFTKPCSRLKRALGITPALDRLLHRDDDRIGDADAGHMGEPARQRISLRVIDIDWHGASM